MKWTDRDKEVTRIHRQKAVGVGVGVGGKGGDRKVHRQTVSVSLLSPTLQILSEEK